MPSPLRSPRNLAQWFELDYFRRRRLFRGLYRPVLAASLLLACLGVGWTFLPGKQSVYQAGSLTSAHAMFNQDCARCHTESFPVLRRLWTSDASVRSVPDQACRQCHAGPLHHTCVAQRSCASCHHEHRGETALRRVTDEQCVTCHRDLKCENAVSTTYYPHVTSFAEGQHPEFRLFREGKPSDPGTLRFNHKVHLNCLLDIDRKQLESHQNALRQAGVPPCDVELPKRAVQLDCNSCHELDATGRYMKPINFAQHCQQCHPLSVQLMGSWQGEQRERACGFSTRPAPHPTTGETAEVVRATLRERLTSFILRPANKSFLGSGKAEELPRPVPGWTQGEPVPPREFAWVHDQLKQIEHVLFDGGGGCKHCHEEKTVAAKRPDGLPEYQPVNLLGVKKPWFEHAVFRHDSHQMLKCVACHEKAEQSTSARDVMLPGINNCLQCHHASGERGAARSDCVECHTYHDPTGKRQFQGTLTIEQTLGK